MNQLKTIPELKSRVTENKINKEELFNLDNLTTEDLKKFYREFFLLILIANQVLA